VIVLPMYGPAVALESTATTTPCLNLKASVVVPWSKWIFTLLSCCWKFWRFSTGCKTTKHSNMKWLCFPL